MVALSTRGASSFPHGFLFIPSEPCQTSRFTLSSIFFAVVLLEFVPCIVVTFGNSSMLKNLSCHSRKIVDVTYVFCYLISVFVKPLVFIPLCCCTYRWMRFFCLTPGLAGHRAFVLNSGGYAPLAFNNREFGDGLPFHFTQCQTLTPNMLSAVWDTLYSDLICVHPSYYLVVRFLQGGWATQFLLLKGTKTITAKECCVWMFTVHLWCFRQVSLYETPWVFFLNKDFFIIYTSSALFFFLHLSPSNRLVLGVHWRNPPKWP